MGSEPFGFSDNPLTMVSKGQLLTSELQKTERGIATKRRKKHKRKKEKKSQATTNGHEWEPRMDAHNRLTADERRFTQI
jgi:hypothetical protein